MDEQVITEQTGQTTLPLPGWTRLLYGLFVVGLPVASFLMVRFLEPEWQSGRFADYLILFLFPESAAFVILLMVYSVICYLSLLSDPESYAPNFWIRFGVYTGTVISFQYVLILTVYFAATRPPFYAYLLIPLAWAFPWLLTKAFRWAWNSFGNAFLTVFFIAVALTLILFVIFQQMIFFLLVLLFYAGPFWCFLIALQSSWWLFKNHAASLNPMRGIGILVWLAGYSAALRYNFVKMYELYAALPPQPPDCYIATAAANGHAEIVRSEYVQLKSGKTMQLNRQLQRFKCVELALISAAPDMHRVIRRVYDSAGRKLAARIRTPLKADAAYFLLKPLEWISYLLVVLFIPEARSISLKIYKP